MLSVPLLFQYGSYARPSEALRLTKEDLTVASAHAAFRNSLTVNLANSSRGVKRKKAKLKTPPASGSPTATGSPTL